MALRASYVCAVVAAGLLALHFKAALLPAWTQGIALLSGGLALAGVGLAAHSFGSEGWTDIRCWPAHLAFGLNALLGAGFIASVTPAARAAVSELAPASSAVLGAGRFRIGRDENFHRGALHSKVDRA
jgi:hypothetical protein